MACQFGFKRVIGLELSQELSRIAKKNVDSYQRAQRGSCDIQVICENAADFYIPPGKTLLYFYNPFMENVMRAVLSNIQRGLGEAFRDITIIYYNPLYGHLFNSADFLDCVKKGRASTRFIKVLRSRDVLTQLGQPTDPKISPLQARKPPL